MTRVYTRPQTFFVPKIGELRKSVSSFLTPSSTIAKVCVCTNLGRHVMVDPPVPVDTRGAAVSAAHVLPQVDRGQARRALPRARRGREINNGAGWPPPSRCGTSNKLSPKTGAVMRRVRDDAVIRPAPSSFLLNC